MNDYDFSTLEAEDFEKLSIDLISRDKDKRFERFKAGRDGGIDGRYYGEDEKQEIIQCKHYLKTGYNGLISSLKKKNNGKNEADKVKLLDPKKYIFVTSLPLSASNKKEIREIFEPYIKKDSDIYGQEDLNDLLKANHDIEENHYKLWISSTTVFKRILRDEGNGNNQIVFNTLKDASCFIQKILDDNKRIFKAHGPNSSSNNVDDLRMKEELYIWEQLKKEKIIPNNDEIYKILSNIKKIEKQELTLIQDMKNHIEAFKQHVFGKNVNYSKYQFPISFQILITKYCYKNVVDKKHFIKYEKWINQYISDNIKNIENKYFFGSVLYSSEPNDIDLLLYGNISTELSSQLNQMDKDFKLFFSKELHQTVFSLTEKENFNKFRNKILEIKEF